MSRSQTVSSDPSLGSYRNYITGYMLSLVLTGASFFLVQRHFWSGHFIFSDNYMLTALIFLSVTQLFVQLIFFLHLDKDSDRRWNLTVLAFAATVVITIVFGTLWIMKSIDSRQPGYSKTHDGQKLKSPQKIDEYIIKNEGIKK